MSGQNGWAEIEEQRTTDLDEGKTCELTLTKRSRDTKLTSSPVDELLVPNKPHFEKVSDEEKMLKLPGSNIAVTIIMGYRFRR